jgi:hypothetical protein
MSPDERKVDLSKRENLGAILGALGGAVGSAMLGGGAGCREEDASAAPEPVGQLTGGPHSLAATGSTRAIPGACSANTRPTATRPTRLRT